MKSLLKRQFKVYKNSGICKPGNLSQGLSHASATFENLPKKIPLILLKEGRSIQQLFKSTATNKSTSFYAGCKCSFNYNTKLKKDFQQKVYLYAPMEKC